MFIAKLQGGLGNQIFQWARVRSLSAKHGILFYLDLSYFDNQQGVTPRTFSLNKLPNLTYHIYERADKPIIIIPDDFHYEEQSYDNWFCYYFDGFWQSEKYFKHSEEIIRWELSPSREMLAKLNGIVDAQQKTISLHIRRTDYITYSEFHPLLPIEYYEEAIRLIGAYDSLLVFSDDIVWCRENLSFDRMIFIENQDDVEDLWLMSLCRHHVIANSSFSWWGAWLNNKAAKKVVAPKVWFGNKFKVNARDILPESWITI